MRRWFAPVIIGATIVASLIVYPRLPARVPLHWGVRGEVDRWGSPLESVVFLPAAMIVVWLLLRFLPRIDARRMSYEKFADTYDLVVSSLLALFAVMQGAMLATALGWPIPMTRLAPALVGVLLIVLGSALPRARPNWWFGIRTPWTLSNDRVWMQTHRIGGHLMLAAGAITLIAALLPTPWMLGAAFAAVLVAGFGSLVYSYFAWKKEASR
jgi:uncharacterized membrane protein